MFRPAGRRRCVGSRTESLSLRDLGTPRIWLRPPTCDSFRKPPLRRIPMGTHPNSGDRTIRRFSIKWSLPCRSFRHAGSFREVSVRIFLFQESARSHILRNFDLHWRYLCGSTDLPSPDVRAWRNFTPLLHVPIQAYRLTGGVGRMNRRRFCPGPEGAWAEGRKRSRRQRRGHSFRHCCRVFSPRHFPFYFTLTRDTQRFPEQLSLEEEK